MDEQNALEALIGAQLSVDPQREQRKGIPEVILAERKTTEQVVVAASRFLATTGRALISRVSPSHEHALREAFASLSFDWRSAARMALITTADYVAPDTGGRVAVLCAGASDIPVADEAVAIAEAMGCSVSTAYDVGVAGLHRLVAPLERFRGEEPDCVVVAAGMDGALPSVVSGIVPIPVIGLPTSIGYGAGGRGLAALLSMLQTCAPGLVVVNIDNGIGAGATAALIANRAARARGRMQH